MTTQEIKAVLFAKRDACSVSREVARNEIAIERNAEEMDEIHQGAARGLALDSLKRQREMACLANEALERIERNSFGFCAECEGQISEKRLRALPWAKYCIHCQEARDNPTAESRYTGAAFRARFAD
jgi:DnaK suppressor protein